jgi:nucleoside-diphosphate-sugar epimerase
MPCIVLQRFDDDAHFPRAMVRRVVERQNPIEVWGDGKQHRDVVHAADVPTLNWSAVQGRIYQFAPRTNRTGNLLTSRLIALSNHFTF